MSAIQSIQTGYQQKNKYNFGQNYMQKQNFKGASEAADDVVKTLTNEATKEVRKQTGATGWLSFLLNDTNGEVQNQLINAAFTTTLAPMFIAWNPFSKQDENTKKYTALRQPVSAAIAISGGFAMTVAINNFMDRIGSEGHLETIDVRINPGELYLKSKFRKKYKAAENEVEFLEQYKPKDVEPEFVNGKPSGKYLKACLGGYIKKVRDDRKNLFASLIGENPEYIKIDEATSKITLEKPGEATLLLGENIPRLKTAQELAAYTKANNIYERTLGDFMKEHFNFEFYEDGTIKPSTLGEKIDTIKAMDFLRKIGLVGENTQVKEKGITEPELQKIFSTLDQLNNVKSELNDAFTGRALRTNGDKLLAESLGKSQIKTVQMIAGQSYSNSEKITLNQLLQVLLAEKDENGQVKVNVPELMKMKMSDILTVLSDKLKTAKCEHCFDAKAGLKAFATNMLKTTIANIEKSFKNYKTFTGIFFNLFTTAITCTALNWAYPRFVETFFPSLTKDKTVKETEKAQKGGNE